jgi:hypothetical protein
VDHDWCAVLVGRVHHPSGLFLNDPGVLFFKGRPELLEILIDLDHLLTIWLSLTTLPHKVVSDNPRGEFFMFGQCDKKLLTCLTVRHRLSVDTDHQRDAHGGKMTAKQETETRTETCINGWHDWCSGSGLIGSGRTAGMRACSCNRHRRS